jgi:hypothetical protein
VKLILVAKALGAAARAITPTASEHAERAYLRFISISLGESDLYCNSDTKDVEL